MQIRNAIVLVALFAAPLVAQMGCTNTKSEDLGSVGPGDSSLANIQKKPHVSVCPTAQPGAARCLAHVITDAVGQVVVAAAPQGLGPTDLASAYALPSGGGAGKTVALVDAYDNPYAERDLGTYRTQYGLPPCTTANGCFKKVNQRGQQTNYPQASSNWAGEISLDVQMVSATCPSCKILLVETDTANMNDLGAGVNIAVQLGAVAVSNSYGGGEDASVTQESEQYFNHPGVLITASSGDGAYGVNYPASSQYVVGVGGTSLVRSSGSARGWAEGAWADAGSGCSSYSPKPSWQHDTGCARRTVSDVSAVADPNTGVAVYSTYDGGWIVLGGTSASSPIVAAIFALTGQTGQTAQYLYSNPSFMFDVTSGSNGNCGTYLCNARAGYDGPTGLGTPNAALWAHVGGGGGGMDAGGGAGMDAGEGGTMSPPHVALATPADGASVPGNATVQLVANVTASAGVSDVVLVWTQASGTVNVDCNAPPSGVTCATNGANYTFSFPVTTGSRTWSVSATDRNGVTVQSETRMLTLVDSSRPSITFDAPPNGSIYSPGDMVQIVVEASAPAGVNQVWLAWNGSQGEQDYQMAHVSGSRWTLTLPGILANAPHGPRGLTATVYDAQGATSSAALTIQVQ